MAVRWARLRRRLVIGVAVGLAALVVLAALAHLPVVRAGLLSIASARLRDRAGIELAARRLDYNLLTRWVTLEDVRLSARGSPHPFFEAPRARARLSWSVLIGTLAFDAVEIASPHVTFVRDPAGGWNLPHSTRQGPSSISWRIGRLLVSDLTFALNDAAGQRLDIDAEGVAITAGSTLVPRELRGHLTVSTRAHVGLDERTIDMTSLDGDFVYGDTGVALERVHATGPAGTLTVDGHVGPFDDPQLDLQIAGAIDVGRLERWVPLAGLSGTASVTGHIAGPASALRGGFDLASDQLDWQPYLDARQVTARVELEPDSVHVRSAVLETLGGRLSASGAFDYASDGARSVQIAWHAVDVERAERAWRQAVPLSVSGLATGRTEISWRGPTLDDVSITAVNDTTPRQGPLPLSGHLEGSTQAGVLHVTHEHDLGGARITGDLDLTLPRGTPLETGALTGPVAVVVADARAWLGELSRAGIAIPAAVTDGLRGAFELRGDVGGTLADPVVTGSLDAPALVATPLADPLTMHVPFVVDQRHVGVTDGRITAGDSSGTLALDASFADNALDGRITVERFDLSRLADAEAVRWAPGGRASAVVTIGGTAASPHLTAEIAGTSLSAAGQQVDELSATVSFAERVWTAGPVLLRQARDGEQGTLATTARFDAGTDALDIKVAGQNFTLGSRAPMGEPSADLGVRGRFDLTGEVHGTLHAPGGRLRLTHRNTEIQNVRLDSGEIDIAFHDGSAAVGARWPALAGTLEATVRLASPWPVTGSLQLDGTTFDALWNALHAVSPDAASRALAEIEGTVAATVRGTATFGTADSWSAAIDLQRIDGTVGSTPVRLAKASTVSISPATLRVRDLELLLGSTTLRAGGVVGLREGTDASDETDLTVRVEGQLQDIGALAALDERLDGLTLNGPIRAGAVVRGSVRQPDAVADLETTGASIGWRDVPKVEDLRVVVAYRGGVATISSLDARWQGAAITGSGTVPMRTFAEHLPAAVVRALPDTADPARVKVRVEGLSEKAIDALLEPDQKRSITGTVTGTAELEATALRVDAARGTLVIDTLTAVVAGVTLTQASPARIDIDRGAARIEDWTLRNAGNELKLAGELALQDPFDVKARVQGVADLRTIGAVVRSVGVGGYGTLDVRVSGPLREPSLEGLAYVSDGFLRIPDPRFTISELNTTLRLDRSHIEIVDGWGNANGGVLSIAGSADLAGRSLEKARVTLEGHTMALEFPEGLRSEMDATLELTYEAETPMISGRVQVLHGAYRDPINLTRQLLSGSRDIKTGRPGARPLEALGRLALDVTVVTEEDVGVDNNYARVQLSSDLRITGTVTEPTMTGRITMGEGGELYLGGNTYHVESGTIDFKGGAEIRPELAITARSRVGQYEVRMLLSGEPGNLRTSLTADPTLSEAEIVALLVTGDPHETNIVGSMNSAQVMGLLSGELSGFVSRTFGVRGFRVERGLGSTASDFDLVSSNTDPTTRLTLEQQVNQYLGVIVSQNLRESGQLTWVFIVRPRRNIEVRTLSRDDGTRALELRQEFTFGGVPRRIATSTLTDRQSRIVSVEFEGAPGFTPRELSDVVSLDQGDRFDFARWQRDKDRLEGFYRDRGYLEVRIRAQRETEASGSERRVRIRYTITRGPLCQLTVTGAEVSSATLKKMKDLWTNTSFDELLASDFSQEVRQELATRDLLQARADVTIERADPADPQAAKTARIVVTPGPPVPSRTIEFVGAQALEPVQLEASLKSRDLLVRGWLLPEDVAAAVRETYEGAGYLAADASVDPPVFGDGTATMTVRITEGPRFHIGDVGVEGARGRPSIEIVKELGLTSQDAYEASKLEVGRRAVDQAYRKLGFNDVRASVTTALRREDGLVDVTLSVVEGPQQILRELTIAGNRVTSNNTIRREFRGKPGTPANLDDWYRSQQRLYDTGVFQSIELKAVPVEAPPPAVEEAGERQLVDASLVVREAPLYRFRYGVQVANQLEDDLSRSTEPGILLDFERRNLLGRAFNVGAATQLQPSDKAARAFVLSPRMFGRNIRTGLYFSLERETLRAEGAPLFYNDVSSITLEQRFRARQTGVEFSYSYRYEWNHTFGADEQNPFDLAFNIARLNTVFLLDRRDSVLDARKGVFHSSNVEYAAQALGSDIGFIKYLVQQFQYPRLGPVVLASAVRVGLAWPLDNSIAIIPSERFFAGGGGTVRGYAEDSLGRLDPLGRPAGGSTMVVLNQEARFPIYKWLRGVGFVDAGNVFDRVRDFAFEDLRVGYGLGLRIDTGFALLRVDLGIPTNRTSRDATGRWYFSIGQMF